MAHNSPIQVVKHVTTNGQQKRMSSKPVPETSCG